MEIDRFFAENDFSENTTDRYKRTLKIAEAELEDLADLDSIKFKVWLGSHNWGSSSQWIAFCAIRKYLRWAFGEQHPALRVRIRRLASEPQRALNAEQVIKLLASFDRRKVKGIRDLAICALMLDTGLRKAEVCRLSILHVDLVSQKVGVITKGGRWGTGVFSEVTKLYLSEWLSVRAELAKCEACFINTWTGGALTRDGFGTMVRRWGEKVGFKLTPHDLRRTFAVLSTRAGAPARVLQVAGRWSSLEMVEHYTARIEADDFRPWFPVAYVMGN